jgi:hypothetical protein
VSVLLAQSAGQQKGEDLKKQRKFIGTAITYLIRKHGIDRWTLCRGNFVFIQREFQKASQLYINVKTIYGTLLHLNVFC